MESPNPKSTFLGWVRQCYGIRVFEKCTELLKTESEEFAPLAILDEACSTLYQDQLSAAAAMDDLCFDSD